LVELLLPKLNSSGVKKGETSVPLLLTVWSLGGLGAEGAVCVDGRGPLR
jgi:hypothetical protein